MWGRASQTAKPTERLSFVEVPPQNASQDFRSAVEEGMSAPQKTLPCRFFYDAAGSDLFERITALPEYYLTGCEAQILAQYSPEIVEAMSGPFSIIEFGSGSSAKTRHLLSAATSAHGKLSYSPIDISRDFLRESSIALLAEYPCLEITAIASEYFDAVTALPRSSTPRLFLFLGSNIGNFEPEQAQEFLSLIGSTMRAGDRLLIGIDLIKDVGMIEAAYNDSAGVTEAFNKNLLARINRELSGQFDLDLFEHHAPFVADKERVEMRLICRQDHEVEIGKLGRRYHFVRGEYIHTENSCKYSRDSFAGLCRSAGLIINSTWSDPRSLFSAVMLERES